MAYKYPTWSEAPAIGEPAKKKKKKPVAAKTNAQPEPETPSNVVSIMDALKKSIAKEKAGK